VLVLVLVLGFHHAEERRLVGFIDSGFPRSSIAAGFEFQKSSTRTRTSTSTIGRKEEVSIRTLVFIFELATFPSLLVP
jgi:hypothetical protein